MAHETPAPAAPPDQGFQPEQLPDALSKRVFVLTMIGAVAFVGVVLFFVL